MPSTLVSQGRVHMLSCLVVTAKHPPPLLHTGLGFAEEQAQVRYTLRCNGGPDARTVLSWNTEHCVS